MYWSWLLQLSYTHLFILVVFWLILFFSRWVIILSVNKDSHFPSSFIIWILFTSFSCLITLSRTSSTVFSRSDKSGNPWLVLDLREETFKFFTIQYDVNCFWVCVCVCGWLLSDWRSSLLFVLFRGFFFKIRIGCWILANAFSVAIKIIMCFCCL